MNSTSSDLCLPPSNPIPISFNLSKLEVPPDVFVGLTTGDFGNPQDREPRLGDRRVYRLVSDISMSSLAIDEDKLLVGGCKDSEKQRAWHSSN